MNQVAIKNNISHLPAIQQQFLKLRLTQSPVKNMEPHAVKKALVEILVKAAFDMGSPMADNAVMLKFQTEAFFNELRGRFAELTILELKEAFNRGIRGEFGQFFGMCPQTYHKFIKHFYELPERQKAWLEYLANLENITTSSKPVHFTPEQLKQFAINDFETFRQSGKLPFYPHATYNTICEAIGTEITVNGEAIKTLITDRDKARDLFLKASKEYMGNLDTNFRRGLITADEKAKLSDLHKMRSFEFLLKKYYLVEFFKGLVKEGRGLELILHLNG